MTKHTEYIRKEAVILTDLSLCSSAGEDYEQT